MLPYKTLRTCYKDVFNHLAENPAPIGRIGLLEGSSGGEENRYLELVLRGGSAERAFAYPAVSDYGGTAKFHSRRSKGV